MSPHDLVYVGHMLDMAGKAVAKIAGLSREGYDADVSDDLPKLVAVLEPLVPPVSGQKS